MAINDHTLLVEGEADRGFFEVMCRSLGLEARVEVAPPRRFGAGRDTKQAAFNILPMLLEDLVDREDGRLAVVVDADNHAHGGGFLRTVEQFSNKVKDYGYRCSNPNVTPPEGLIFHHDDGLNDLGLWVMPNNADEGMLEHWLAQCLLAGEQPWFDHASRVLDELPFDPKFKPLHRPKAEIATWLAWQERPGEGLYNALDAGLIDKEKPLYRALADWLERIFPEPGLSD